MKLLTTVSLIVLIAASSLLAQQKPKRLPGINQLFGPVHTVRDEQATLTNKEGELVEGPRELIVSLSYNEDGTKLERTTYHQGQIIHRFVETYDPDGRLLESDVLNAAGVLESHSVITYDAEKRMSERLTYRKDGSLANRTVYRRQDGKSQSESISYDLKGNVISGSSTTNDFKTKQAESRMFNPRGTTSTQVSMVDNPDGSREFKEDRSDGTTKREVFKPEGKNQSSRVFYNPDGTVRSTERYLHEYDSYGNIIKTTRLVANGDSKDFQPASVSYRAITYYEKN